MGVAIVAGVGVDVGGAGAGPGAGLGMEKPVGLETEGKGDPELNP
jgi:hypothetical protein